MLYYGYGMVYCMICSWSNKYLYLLLSSFPTEKIKKEERERKEERKKERKVWDQVIINIIGATM